MIHTAFSYSIWQSARTPSGPPGIERSSLPSPAKRPSELPWDRASKTSRDLCSDTPGRVSKSTAVYASSSLVTFFWHVFGICETCLRHFPYILGLLYLPNTIRGQITYKKTHQNRTGDWKNCLDLFHAVQLFY